MEEKQKFRLYSVAPYFYAISEDTGYTVRYIIRMKEDIDGDALKKAFETAMERYPYLRVKLVRGIFSDCLEYNDAPLVVLNTSQALTLGAQTNGHLIALTYNRRSIYINNSHGLVDGRGRGPFMRTLMHFYSQFRYGEASGMENVNLPGSPIDPEEYEDPFRKKLPSVKKLKLILPPLDSMSLKKMGKVTPGDPLVHCISINEKLLIDWCRQHDATPNTVFALMMSRAIRKIHPDSKKKITAGVICDLRNTLNAPKSHWSLIYTTPLVFDEKIEKMSIKDQCTVFRGQLLLKSDPSEMAHVTSMLKKIFSLIYIMPKPIKRVLSRLIMSSTNGLCTFSVSYTGKSSYGNCDKHIRGLYAEINFGTPMMLEVTVADGNVIIDANQYWKEDIYIREFCRELSENGIPNEITYIYDQRRTLMETES